MKDRIEEIFDQVMDCPEPLRRFAELVAADEREACANLCESMGVHPALNVYNGGPEWYQRQKECATAIRARSKHEQD